MYTAEQLERELNQTNFPMERYKPIEKLGGSAVSSSYLCYDEFLEDEVVVKKLGILEFDELIPFQREATALCRIRNKSLAQVVDFGATTEGAVYLVYEYQTGSSLKVHLRGKDGSLTTEHSLPLSPELAYRAFIPVAEALAAMHSQGILHRDIKASNILMRNLEAQDSAIYLIDAGSGRVSHATAQQISYEGRTVTGDPNYLAPEQLLSQQYDARSEIFAFGCVFFEALTGRTPFSGDDALPHLARRSPPSLSQVSDGLTYNYRIEGFVRRCLERNPDARYKSMQEVLYALKDLVKNKVSIDKKAETGMSGNVTNAEPEKERARARRAKFKSTGNKLKLLVPDEEQLNSEAPVSAAPKDSHPKDEEATAGETVDVLEKKQDHVSLIQSSEPPVDSQKPGASGIQNTTNSSKSPTKATGGSGTISTQVDSEENKFKVFIASIQQMATWVTTTRQGLIALVIVSTTIVCGWLTFSYVEYLVAPRSEEEGLVYAYEPATNSHPGQLTLGVETGRPALSYLTDGKPLGLLEKHHIVIESPADNLPEIESGPGFSNELHDTTLFDRDSLNLSSMRSERDREEEEESESDVRIGETWRVKIRTQNGTRYLESVKNGSAYLINPEMQDVHMAITKMYRALIAQSHYQDKRDNQYAYINPDWAASDFNTSVTLRPPPRPMARPILFPAEDIKLKSFDGHCEVLIRAPGWMTGVGFLDVTLRVERDGWRIMDIAPATQAEWEEL